MKDPTGSSPLVDLENTVIIMTSSIGSPHLLEDVMPNGEINRGRGRP